MKKQIVLFWILSALFLSLGLFFMSRIFVQSDNFSFYVLAALFYILGLITLSFLAFFTAEKKVFYVLAAFLFILVFIIYPLHYLQLLSAAGLSGAILEFKRKADQEVKEKVHFSFYKDSKNPMIFLFLAIIFMASLNLFMRSAYQIRQNPEAFYSQTATLVVKGLEPVLAARIENFSLQKSLAELVAHYFEGPSKDAEASGSDPEDLVLNLFGEEYSGDQPTGEILFQVVKSRVIKVFEPIRNFVPLFYAILLFLTLRIVVPVLVFLARLLGAGVFKLGLKLGFWRLIKKNVEVEVPELT